MFVCTENSCRSQMAEGFSRHLAAPRALVSQLPKFEIL
jgi:protein-tyrosine-phosphatase